MAARLINRLSDRRVKTAPSGVHCDGGGLYLQATVGADGGVRRSWLFRFATGEVRLSRSDTPRIPRLAKSSSAAEMIRSRTSVALDAAAIVPSIITCLKN